MIEEYHFGSITISGKTYTHDVEVRWTGEVLKWWRKESHVIDLEDVKRAVEQNPDTIILGTGAYGVAKVAEEAKN
ncbi:MAG: MTH938/NDUFAF3 family protein, partial [Patescibacteria group bacterium]|nr:MTH938/NDUFAF3 family protein [Patescibacteria group bacterium]